MPTDAGNEDYKEVFNEVSLQYWNDRRIHNAFVLGVGVYRRLGDPG